MKADNLRFNMIRRYFVMVALVIAPIIFLLSSQESFAANKLSFTEKQVRYLTPFDLMQTLAQVFAVKDFTAFDKSCLLTEQNRSLLGDSIAATGSPMFSEPSAAFIRWYGPCLHVYVDHDSTWMQKNEARARELLGDECVDWVLKQYGALDLNFAWVLLPTAVQNKVRAHLREQMLGPDEIITDLGYFATAAEFDAHIEAGIIAHSNESVINRVAQYRFLIAMRDEFLSY